MNRRNFLAGIGAAATSALLPGKSNDVYANPVTLGEMPEKVDVVQDDQFNDLPHQFDIDENAKQAIRDGGWTTRPYHIDWHLPLRNGPLGVINIDALTT